MAKLLSINVGLSKVVAAAEPPFDREWISGIFKEPVAGKHFIKIPISAREPAIIGDRQEDTRFHGGPDNAINVFPYEHYSHWMRHLGLDEFGFGAFGENITSEGHTETDVCVGDIFEIGEARLQLSQPRQPCWKLAWKWKAKDFVKELVHAGTTGWYLRVLREGTIEAGDEIMLVERLYPDWTVHKLNAAMLNKNLDAGTARELAELPELSKSWRKTFANRIV
jgi:MOSC domain-containing protein YiiM